MTDTLSNSLRAQLRRLRGGRTCAAAADAELLRRFATDGDELAFTEIVRRHGPLVLGVAHRVLGRREDAEIGAACEMGFEVEEPTHGDDIRRRRSETGLER